MDRKAANASAHIRGNSSSSFVMTPELSVINKIREIPKLVYLTLETCTVCPSGHLERQPPKYAWEIRGVYRT